MKNIVLTGFMGSGKTTVGGILANRLNMTLTDLDSEIEREAGMSINDIFAKFGEPHFRELETSMAAKYSKTTNQVISTGGGIVLRSENMEYLGGSGFVVCLWAQPETILKRVAGNDDRPLLKVPDPMKKIRELLDFRRSYYEQAKLMVITDDKTPDTVADEIIAYLKEV